MSRSGKTRKSLSIITGAIAGTAVFAVSITALTDSSDIDRNTVISETSAVYHTDVIASNSIVTTVPSVTVTHKVAEKKTTTQQQQTHTESETAAVSQTAAETDITQPQTDPPSCNNDEAVQENTYEEEIQTEAPEEFVENEQNAECCEVHSPQLSLIGNFNSTAYTWTGSTCASGNYPYSSKNIDGINYRTVAVDSSVIPLGTRLYIEAGDYTGYAIAEDTGGYINGYILDLYMDSYYECINWGRRNITVYTVI